MIQVIQTSSSRLNIPVQGKFWQVYSCILIKGVLPIDLVAARDGAGDGKRGGR